LVAAGTATATGVSAIGRHVWAIIVPVTLGPVSPQPWVAWGEPAAWGSAALVLAVCAAGYALRTRAPVFAWGLACGVSGLLPVLALPFVTNVGLVQPHRGYQAMAGFALAIAACLEAGTECVRSMVRSESGRRVLRNAGVAFALVCTVVLVAADVTAGRVWRDEIGFWERAAAQYPGEAGYHQSLGAARLRAGDLPGALDALSRAAALDPELPRVSYNLGLVYAKLGRIDEAIAAYRRAVATDASDVKALANLGWLFEKRGESDRALVAYRAALQVAPDLPRIRERVAALSFAGSTDEIGDPMGAGRP
jgi:Flp pilus assembly protein TadD